MSFRRINRSDEDFTRRTELVEQSVRDNHTYLLHYVHGMVGQWQDAENIVQDLWRYVVVHFEEHNIQRRSVLFEKARLLVIDHYRASQRKPVSGAVELEEHHMPKMPQEAYTEAEEARLKIAFFESYPALNLTELQKEVLWLHARYGFTYEEIKTMTGKSVSTIGDWITLGRREIAKHTHKEGNSNVR